MSDLYKEILEFNQMSFNREKLIEDYAQTILDGLDMDAVLGIAYDTLTGNLLSYSDEELIKEVKEYNPELLEDVETL
jgi:hypothetical protein